MRRAPVSATLAERARPSAAVLAVVMKVPGVRNDDLNNVGFDS